MEERTRADMVLPQSSLESDNLGLYKFTIPFRNHTYHMLDVDMAIGIVRTSV
jgi:hypothetical protein